MDPGGIDELLRVAADFGNCGQCVYVQSGYPLLCSQCAARTLRPLAPPDARCAVCDHPFTSSDNLCRNPTCNMGDENRGFEWNWSIAMREGVLQQRINDYKFSGKTGWALIFGRILAGFLERHRKTFAKVDMIIPSPVYVSEGSARSWDHIALIVEKAAQEQPLPGFPYVLDPPVIVKTAETPSMSHLTKYPERKANAEGALRQALLVPDVTRVRHKEILVVDDVFTDGLTLREVARCLRAAGADAVYGVALARQRYRGS